MLSPDKEYRFLFDKESMKPACVLIQALYGGDSLPVQLFRDWELAPTKTMGWVKATGKEIEEFARKVQP